MQPSQEPLIKLDGVTKVFYTDEVETHALSGVHLQIVPGEYVSIAGPSGCGKSTLLSILGLLDSPTEGQYTLKGRPVGSLKAAERARIRNREVGFIFQAFNLIGDLTVEVTLDGEKHEVSSPAAVFVPAGMMHTIFPLKGSGYVVVTMRGGKFEAAG